MRLVPFRGAMLRLAADLRDAIGSGISDEAIRHHAKFIVDTKVRPDLDALRARLEDHGAPWRQSLIDLGLSAPEIGHYYASGTLEAAITKTIGKVMGVVTKVTGQLNAERKEARARGLAYLLKLERTVRS